MKTTVTFHIEQDQKKELFDTAARLGLSTSSFCRVKILEILNQNKFNTAKNE